jgi:flagellar biosynthesis/type III secretory pathway protein FliH
MSEAFVPLAVFLRPAFPLPAREAAASPPPNLQLSSLSPEQEEAVRAARRFRAGLADALEVALAQLLRAIAREVLGRELQLSYADVAAIASSALQRFVGEEPIAIRAHPDDLADLAGIDINQNADNSLSRGDIAIELRSGSIDLRLETRLDEALAVWRASGP